MHGLGSRLNVSVWDMLVCKLVRVALFYAEPVQVVLMEQRLQISIEVEGNSDIQDSPVN